MRKECLMFSLCSDLNDFAMTIRWTNIKQYPIPKVKTVCYRAVRLLADWSDGVLARKP